MENVGNPYAAAELADVLFTEGSPAAVPKIVDSINEVRASQGLPPIASSTRIDKSILKAYSDLAGDPNTCGALMDAVAKRRAKQFQNGRADFFRFSDARTD